MATAGMTIRNQRGLTYVGVLVAVVIVPVVIVALTMGLSQGMRLASMATAKTELLNAAQQEMERVRGIRFTDLQDYTVSRTDVTGLVTVEEVTARRKRVSVSLQHTAYPNQNVALVTYAHQDGLTF